MDEHEEPREDDAGTADALRAPLSALAATVRPTAAAGTVVRRGVRRRRRLRAAVTAAGSVAAVTAVAVAATVLPGGSGGSGGEGPSPAEEPTAALGCPLEHRVFRDPAPIPDLAAQERVVAEVRALVRDVWTVRHAEPTALGVVALVQGNVGLAEEQLPEHGVALVAAWQGEREEAGVDASGQVERVLEWELLPVADRVQRATSGLPGGAGIALWKDAGAVVLSWRAPAPPEVLALAEEEGGAGGVRVLVDEVRWSSDDIQRASEKLWEQTRRAGDADVTSSSPCGDLSGLVVTVTEPLDERRRRELQERFAGVAGMPVTVVEGGPVVELGEDRGELSD